MTRNRRALTVGTLVSATFFATTVFGATTTTTADGGSIQTHLGYDIVLNE